MSTPFCGEIKIFSGNFAIRDWAYCGNVDQSLIHISQNPRLFSLLGTIYGGDGRTTFALPDLRGRVPIHYGSGPGLTPRRIGSKGGTETVTLTTNQLPTHSHNLMASNKIATSLNPTSNLLAATDSLPIYDETTSPNTKLEAKTIGNVGDHAPHTNLQPYLCLTVIIALEGAYPTRPHPSSTKAERFASPWGSQLPVH